MPEKLTIVEITAKGRRMLLKLDDGQEIFLCKEIAFQNGLKKGDNITPVDIDKLAGQSRRFEAENYVAYLLARREYSSGQLREKLALKEYDPGLIRELISKLKKGGLLDDSRFARNIITSLLNRKPAGKAFLIAYLRQRHISQTLAEQAVAEALENIDESAIAERLLAPKLKGWRKFGIDIARRKAYNYLSRRSIGYGAAKTVFDKLWDKE